MKFYNKILSLLTAIVMIFSSVALPVPAFAEDGNNQTVSANDENIESGDYDDMLLYFREQMKKRVNNIKYKLVTSNKKYVDYYNDSSLTDKQQKEFGNGLNKEFYFDIFEQPASPSDPFLGDYLYNSIYNGVTNEDRGYTENGGKYEFIIEFTFQYYTTAAQEEYVENFLNKFDEDYIKSNGNITSETDSKKSDYLKVKTIYDFVVRNSSYDWDVFHDSAADKVNKNENFPIDGDRYRIAHSAYGALCGNLLKDGKSESDFNIEPKTTISGEKIVKIQTKDENISCQGLAVCEGYSKLFYALCIKEGIPCRIVDGDYTENSGKKSDPHEWNFVYLNDGVKTDGARWYIVDTTFASQNSIKEIDYNSYDYFLRGSENPNLNSQNHQQPRKIDNANGKIKDQLSDWYSSENKSSGEDYAYPQAKINARENANNGYIIKRTINTTVGNEGEERKIEQVEYIYTNLDHRFYVAINENHEVVVKYTTGFDYTGYEASFTAIMPYLIPDIEYTNTETTGRNAGEYNVTITGSDETALNLPFSILPRDMSNFDGNYDQNQSSLQGNKSYTGEKFEPRIELVDGFDNKLEKGRDYTVSYLKDGGSVSEIKDIGNYTGIIDFIGNYCGQYTFYFSIGKIDFTSNNLNIIATVGYKPVNTRTGKDDATPAEALTSYTVDKYTLLKGRDYEIVSSTGSWDSGGGTITIRGIDSDYVKGGEIRTFNYTVVPFNITNYNGQIYDPGAHIYTGSAIYPSSSSGVSYLQKDVDYKVLSYSNNVNAGEAYVTIQGIGGCTGTAVMRYRITPKSIGGVKLENLSCTADGKFSYTAKDGSKTLQKGTDYNESVTETSNGYKLVLTGINNYTNTYSVDAQVDKQTKNQNVSTGSSNASGSTGSSSSSQTKVKKPTLKSVKSKKKRTLVISWKKPSGKVSGYKVQYSTSKNFKKGVKTVTLKKSNYTSLTVKKLKSKKKYYVRVRAYYKKGSKTYYTGYSKVKSVKIK